MFIASAPGGILAGAPSTSEGAPVHLIMLFKFLPGVSSKTIVFQTDSAPLKEFLNDLGLQYIEYQN
jgi:hypothetical protein